VTAVLELRNVGAAYGPTQVLKAVNLAVEEQGMAALLGGPAAIIARDDAVRRAYLGH
jgi:ABC-type branched-subunit amino acid transport system ATPase component